MSKLKLIIAALAAAILITTSIGGVSALDSVTEAQTKTHAPLKVYKAYPNGKSFKLKEAKRFALYFTDSKDIARVSLTGVVKPKNVGETRIRIVRLGDETKAVTIKVAKKQKISAPQFINATYQDEVKNMDASTNANGIHLSYESKDPDIVKVNGKGDLTFGEVGKTDIVISAKGNKLFHEAQVRVPVAVGKKQAEIALAQPSLSVPMNYKDVKVEPASDSDGKFIFESADKAIVTVGEDGLITPVKEGKTTIKIKQEETKNFLPAEKTVDIEVTTPTASKEALAAVEWAKMIANDNSFAYGAGKKAHRGGCYFCGTNKKKKPKGYEKTYCCNPFVFAAYAHGAEIPSVLRSCRSGGCGGMSPSDWTPHGFTLLGEAKNVPYEELLPGDVILSDQNKNHWLHHVWMVTEDDQYVEASGGGWGKNSIAVKSNLKKNYGRYQRHFCQVMRYEAK